MRPYLLIGLVVMSAMAVTLMACSETTILSSVNQGPEDSRFTALDFVRMEACRLDWNTRIKEAASAGHRVDASAAIMVPRQVSVTANGRAATAYVLVTKALSMFATCGYYVVPDSPDDDSTVNITLQNAILSKEHAKFQEAAQVMLNTVLNSPITPPEVSSDLQKTIDDIMDTFANKEAAVVYLLTPPDPTAVLPIPHLPTTEPLAENDRPNGIWAMWSWLTGHDTDDEWEVRNQVGRDLARVDDVIARLALEPPSSRAAHP